ncbi:E3 SUMO-protein ligase ZBED1-like isoform X2 [Pseudochaenichthys georgianus]
MRRHYRAVHEIEEGHGGAPAQARPTRKQDLDEALVNLIVKDTQPFSVVEDVGFRACVALLDPNCVTPTRQAVKAMVEAKYVRERNKAIADMQKVAAVSLTSDMWTSINRDAYLAVTCHFVDDSTRLNCVLLGVQPFPRTHTAENLAGVKASLVEEWGITDKVTGLVTDGAANMISCGRQLKLRRAICIAHTLHLIVNKSLDVTPVLSDIRAKARTLVGYFRSSALAKEKLESVQRQLGRPTLKLLQEVETRWSSTHHMLQRLVDLREPGGAALASLNTDITTLTSAECTTIRGCLSLLSGFNEATIERSEEKNVSGSKVEPLLKMLEQMLQEEMAKTAVAVAKEMGEHPLRKLRERLHTLQSMSIMPLQRYWTPGSKGSDCLAL